MARGGVDGLALGSIAAGGLFLYAAIKGKSVLGSVQAVIKGQPPSAAPAANPITGTAAAAAATGGASTGGLFGAIAAGGSNASAQTALQQAAASHGWGSGPEWQALQSVELREAGFNIHATNPSSGAYGLAQFIDGPSEYYTYGGDPGTAQGQATAMCNYIAQRYGDPIAAWAHEQSAGWY